MAESLVVGLVLAWLVGMVVGWLTTRDCDPHPRTFNWRIFLGPWAYTHWLDRWSANV